MSHPGRRMGHPDRVRGFRGIMRRLSLSFVAVCVVSSVLASAQQRQSVDLMISGGIVVTMDGVRAIYHDGSVAVRGDAIVAVGPRADLEVKYRAAQVLDARGHLVLPGFING